MNIFHTFTKRCLKENKTRTVVTIIGIVLSMSLFTAVIEGAYSGLQFLLRSEISYSGSWHGIYSGIGSESEERLKEDDRVGSLTAWTQVGWADIDSINEYKPYLLIKSVDDNFEDLVSIRLVSGRLPENDAEILIPEHLSSNGGVALREGERITLKVGERYSGGLIIPPGSEFTPGEEELLGTEEKTYTVVGFYQRFPSEIEYFSCPGYTAITKGASGGKRDVFFALKKIRNYNDFILSEEYADILQNNIRHSDLLNYSGITRNATLNSVIIGFAAVLVILVSFGSISLIYNSFSISVNERAKLFGILKSVGATKKQIRSSVLYESMLLGLVGIPIGLLVGCTGIGITLYCLRDSFAIIDVENSGTQMKLVLNYWAILIAVAVCFVTTVISAWIPARRAMNYSPIDSIRQTEDIKLKAREVKTSRLTQRLFGFEGVMASKNFKRNKRRGRSVVRSLFMSIVLFISASSFCAYLKDTVAMETAGDMGIDISYSITHMTIDEVEGLRKELSEVKGVTSSYVESSYNGEIKFRSGCLDKSFKEAVKESGTDPDSLVSATVAITYISDDTFRDFCRLNDEEPEKFFDKDNPLGLLINVGSTYDYERQEFIDYRLLDAGALPADGIFDPYDGDPGENTAVYRVGAAGYKTIEGISSYNSTIVYPLSMAGFSVNEGYTAPESFEDNRIFFKAEDHARVYDEMLKILTSKGLSTEKLEDSAAKYDNTRMLVKSINVFAYGFIVLITLIALANVFNTITTSIGLRRREFATLRSIGIGGRGFRRMMDYECLIYGIKSLVFGIPVSVAATYGIYSITKSVADKGFYIPAASVGIAVFSVFIVVFSAMIYATGKIKNDNPVETLRNENI